MGVPDNPETILRNAALGRYEVCGNAPDPGACPH